MKITSTQTRINLSAFKLFELAGNCRNFARYMPEQVKDFITTDDSCTFTLENITTVTLKILEKTPFTGICYVAENDKNIPLFLDLKCNVVSENETDVVAELDIEIPFFLKPMIEKPLQRFVEELSNKIKIDAEKTIL
jgi:ribosome-associated toxin RatA of RatAB toxin-antitoxin module